MMRCRTNPLALMLLASVVGCARAAQPPPADLVFTTGEIYTVDAQRTWAESLAVRDGAIVAVGSNAEVTKLIGADTRVVDLAGGMALPGFHDAHVHPVSGGRMLLGCSLYEIFELQPLLDKIRECAAATHDEWIIGYDWDLGVFPDGNPHKSLLDEISPDRPMFLEGSDGHSAWANSKALDLAGITAETPTPAKGVIERDPATGEPTGTLRETARKLITPLLPQPTPADDEAALRAALAELKRYGITSFIDARVGEATLKTYQAIEAAGDLTARVVTSLALGVGGYHSDEDFERALAARGQFASAHLKPDSVKLFVDGVLEGETGALLEPYLGMGEHWGVLNFEPGELAAVVTRFDAMGLQVHFHAIGDRAARVALDALAAARKANGVTDNRHHIAHLQLLHSDDMPRFAQLNATANFQALWAYPDPWIMNINLPVVGQARVERMYPIGSLHRTGGRIVGGSDWSVSSANPLEAIETALLRQYPRGGYDTVLNAAERVDLAIMIDAYTINAAWLMHQENKVGSIEVGKRADLVVLGQNLFEIPAANISDVPILMTVFEGEIIYEADADVLALAKTNPPRRPLGHHVH